MGLDFIEDILGVARNYAGMAVQRGQYSDSAMHFYNELTEKLSAFVEDVRALDDAFTNGEQIGGEVAIRLSNALGRE